MLLDVLKILKAKLYPNATQRRAMVEYLDQARYVFNQCLAGRRDAYAAEKKTLTRYQQTGMLTAERATDDRLRAVPVEVARDAIRRVDLAFQHFFRRVKEKAKKCGYPRFKGANRYNSFTIADCGNVVKGGRIRVSGIDTPICQRGLQPIEGKIKRLTIVRRADEWHARILVEDGLAVPPLKPVKSAIGIDLGLYSFIATSAGETVACPQHYRRLAAKLRRVGKRVSRRVKGSNRRRHAVLQLQKVQAKIADCRLDFLHKLSRQLVDKHQLIVAEKLNIKGLARTRLAKSVLDAGWGIFLNMVDYKAARAGSRLIQVDPAYTSQQCSQCAFVVPKTLGERVHKCSCGLTLDRDVNAARVVLARGLSISTPDPARDRSDVETRQPDGQRATAESLKRRVLSS